MTDDADIYANHHTIVLSHEVILSGPYKLMVAQRGPTGQEHDSFEAGWQYPNYTWAVPSTRTCGMVHGTWEVGVIPKKSQRLKPSPSPRPPIYSELHVPFI